MQTPPLVTSSLRYFDKVLLGAGALWLAVTGIGFAVSPAALSENNDLEEELAAIETYVKTSPVPAAEEPAWTDTLAEQLDPREVPTAEPFPPWAAHKKPKLILKPGVIVPTVEYEHSPPTLDEVEVERGRITLRWTPGDFSNQLISGGFEIERREAEGDWVRIDATQWGENEYVDTSVSAKTTYQYRVFSLMQLELELQRDRGLPDLPEALRRVGSEESDPVVTPIDRFLTVSWIKKFDPVTEPGKVDHAYVFVHLWDEERADWVKKGFVVRVGEAIGEGPFETGATLREVRVDRRAHERIKGHEEKLQVIEFGVEGDPSETANDKDVPK